MSTATPRPLTLFRVDFRDLYERHLCRHSQFGINVAHLAALFGVWYGAAAFLYWLTQAEWVPVALAAAYLALVALNAPLRVCLATALFLALFVAAVLWLPALPWWADLLTVPVFYKLQAWSHKVFTVERDMTEFNKRYPKGPALFVVLLIYEVPLLLNYLAFDRKRWAA
jgi:phosphoglycerol transferase MdoB-like AlkP superfamily enzyme